MDWIGSESIDSHNCTHFVKGMLHVISPWYRSTLVQTGVICQRFEDLGATGPQFVVEIDAPNEHAQFGGIGGGRSMCNIA
jgi:hypothetical protein